MKTPKYEHCFKYFHLVKKKKGSKIIKKAQPYEETDNILTFTEETKEFKGATCELSNEDLELVSGGTSINMHIL